jgi:hypothetical protein
MPRLRSRVRSAPRVLSQFLILPGSDSWAPRLKLHAVAQSPRKGPTLIPQPWIAESPQPKSAPEKPPGPAASHLE